MEEVPHEDHPEVFGTAQVKKFGRNNSKILSDISKIWQETLQILKCS
jgi:hypothetical protein